MKTVGKLILLLLGIPFMVNAQESILTTKHNLSVSGPGTVKAITETEVCIFCHKNLHPSSAKNPNWSNMTKGKTYTLYKSSTMKALPGQPSGSSILCLSCHDGTIALGNIINREKAITFANTVTMPIGPSNFSTDLRNDHPISFTYNVALAQANGHLKTPALIGDGVQLEDEQLQCTSCHDPHINKYTDFLRTTTQNSQLCMKCHEIPEWKESVHNTSVKTWNNQDPNPWPYTPWSTVSENACANCHNSHNSGSISLLLKYQEEERNCLDCHNGNVSSKNIQSELLKTYKHNVYGYNSIHDPKEKEIPENKHVECFDCHNSHAIQNKGADAPGVKGANFGVVGINQNGLKVSSAKYEYEICYRCHSNNAVSGVASVRKISQNDLRLAFDPSNPSYHPIVAAGKNTDIQGLVSPLSANSIIYCTDCHASNGKNSPAGPHGSIYPQILKYNYDRSSNFINTYTAYELCYQCHAPFSTINKHNLLSESRTHGSISSCNTCHDPHGISATQGNTLNNKYLLNFNLKIVSNNTQGLLNWTRIAPGKGFCNLTCHSHEHIESSY